MLPCAKTLYLKQVLSPYLASAVLYRKQYILLPRGTKLEHRLLSVSTKVNFFLWKSVLTPTPRDHKCLPHSMSLLSGGPANLRRMLYLLAGSSVWTSSRLTFGASSGEPLHQTNLQTLRSAAIVSPPGWCRRVRDPRRVGDPNQIWGVHSGCPISPDPLGR